MSPSNFPSRSIDTFSNWGGTFITHGGAGFLLGLGDGTNVGAVGAADGLHVGLLGVGVGSGEGKLLVSEGLERSEENCTEFDTSTLSAIREYIGLLSRPF